jgi:hypothetical protein
MNREEGCFLYLDVDNREKVTEGRAYIYEQRGYAHCGKSESLLDIAVANWQNCYSNSNFAQCGKCGPVILRQVCYFLWRGMLQACSLI